MVKAILVLACSVSLAGCLTSSVVVTVRPDGTGTIEHTTTLRPSALAELDALLPPEARGDLRPRGIAGGGPPQTLTAPPESSAWHWGRGVRMRSAHPLKTVDSAGWKTIYDFDDVMSLGVDLMPFTPGLRAFYGVAATDRFATTRLRMSIEPVADGVHRLTVRFPRFGMDTSAEPPAAAVSGSPGEMAALRNVLKGSRITVAVESEAPLLRTSSPHREANRVTLFDVDLEEALFSRQLAMLAAAPATFEEFLASLSDLPGVTLAREHDVTLEYQVPGPESAALQAAPPLPDTDIFLASLTPAGASTVLGPPVNITSTPGYDSEPSFTPDGRAILFVSGRVVPKAPAPAPPGLTLPDGQTDVYRYDIDARRVSRVTRTPESEHSPAVMPGSARVSVVRVEMDGTQRLWGVPPGGHGVEAALVVAEVRPVGYYAWMDDRAVALYVLGDRGQPATLRLADPATGTSEVAATGVGRSLQRTPAGALSFIQLNTAAGAAGTTAMVTQLAIAPRGRASSAPAMGLVDLVQPAAGVLDPFLAWTPDGALLMAAGATVYRWRPGDRDWTALANLDRFGLRNVTWLAVSPRGDRLALVAEVR